MVVKTPLAVSTKTTQTRLKEGKGGSRNYWLRMTKKLRPAAECIWTQGFKHSHGSPSLALPWLYSQLCSPYSSAKPTNILLGMISGKERLSSNMPIMSENSCPNLGHTYTLLVGGVWCLQMASYSVPWPGWYSHTIDTPTEAHRIFPEGKKTRQAKK